MEKKHLQFSTAASAGSQLLGDDKTPAKTRNAGLERAELSFQTLLKGSTLSTQNWLLQCLRMQTENSGLFRNETRPRGVFRTGLCVLEITLDRSIIWESVSQLVFCTGR